MSSVAVQTNVERKSVSSFSQKLKTILSSNASHYVCMIISFFVCFLYAFLLSNKGMSPAEGWYTTFAELINEKGLVPYKDFELLFPPLYTYIIALYTKIFGYDIISLRILGCFVFAFTGLVLYLIFNKILKSAPLSLILGIAIAGFMQSEVVQIFYDYIRFMDLFVFASVYFFLRFIDEREKENKKFISVNLIFSFVFGAFASLIKQSSGLVFLACLFLLIVFGIIFVKDKKDWAIQLISALLTIAVLYAIVWSYLAYKGALGSSFRANFVSSVGAKGGGMKEILFGWLPRAGKKLLRSILPTIAVLIFIALEMYLSERKRSNTAYLERTNLIIALAVLFVMVLCFILMTEFSYFAKKSQLFDTMKIVYIAFLCNIVFTIVTLVVMIYEKRTHQEINSFTLKYFALSSSSLALSYAVCMSAGLTQGECALTVGLLFVTILYFAKYMLKEIATVSVSVFLVLLANATYSAKVYNIYAWWDIGLGSYYEQKYECEVPILKDIKMSKNYAEMYDGVYNLVLENSEADDVIFTFPQCPIFYTMTGRDSQTFSLVQWMDVTSAKTIEKDIKVLENNLPKIIIMSPISEYALTQHEKMFNKGEKSGSRIMQEYLEKTTKEKYVSLKKFPLKGDYGIEVYLLK